MQRFRNFPVLLYDLNLYAFIFDMDQAQVIDSEHPCLNMLYKYCKFMHGGPSDVSNQSELEILLLGLGVRKQDTHVGTYQSLMMNMTVHYHFIVRRCDISNKRSYD